MIYVIDEEVYEIEPKQVREFVERARVFLDAYPDISAQLMPDIADFSRRPRGLLRNVHFVQSLQEDLHRFAEGDYGASSVKELRRDLTELLKRAKA